MINEDRVEEILHRILGAIMPYQGHDGFYDILQALENAYSFEIAVACPNCRRRLARKLRSKIPAMVTRADQLAASSGAQIKCSLH